MYCFRVRCACLVWGWLSPRSYHNASFFFALQLLNVVRSTPPDKIIEVYVGLNDGETLEDTPETFAGELSLFGLNVASQIDGAHGGNGFNTRLDITDLVQQLRAAGRLNGDEIPITVLRVSAGVAAQPPEDRAIVFYRRTGVVQ